jgi:cation transport ATPase
MVLTRRQLQEKEQQQQLAMEDAPTISNGNAPSSTSSSTIGNKSSSVGIHHPPKTLQHQAMEIAAATKMSQQQQMNGQQRNQQQPQQTKAVTPRWVYILLVVFALLTILTIPHPFHPTIKDGPTVRHVFYYGWLTAMSTGLGALPFLLYPDVGTYWVGISNGTFIINVKHNRNLMIVSSFPSAQKSYENMLLHVFFLLLQLLRRV